MSRPKIRPASIVYRISKDTGIPEKDVARVINFRWKFIHALMAKWRGFETIIENIFRLRRYEDTYLRQWPDKHPGRNFIHSRIQEALGESQGQREE